ncbi:hypothetical protein HNY73_001570 [Argiope bruennichi]|uniref:CCHC-type domain-containing protein n=1 Tax=Argiope bruennichi TaxID=94029 RepID=A0A8T0G5X5_ARGBR|nr:hypothetical protein HNY73_001570 [Argiope bruennichi]
MSDPQAGHCFGSKPTPIHHSTTACLPLDSKIQKNFFLAAVEVLQGIPSEKLTDLMTIEEALESRFGDSHLTQFYRTKLKTRRQEAGESLQVLAADVQRLMSLAYAECPRDVRESLAVQYFVDAIRDEDTQLATRLTDEKDLKSALAYSMKYEVAKTVSRSPRYVRPIEIQNDAGEKSDDKFESLCSMLENLWNSRGGEKNNIPHRNPNVTCWRCNKKGHLQRECSYAVTDFSSQVYPKGCACGGLLVDLKTEAIPVRVLNLNNKPKIVNKGTVIASCDPVVDIVARPQEFSGAHPPIILENLEGLDEQQKRDVRKLLNEFQTCFSICDSDFGR